MFSLILVDLNGVQRDPSSKSLYPTFSYLRGLVDEELGEPIVALRMRHGDTDF